MRGGYRVILTVAVLFIYCHVELSHMNASLDKAKLKKEIYDAAETYDPFCLLEAAAEIVRELYAAMIEIAREENDRE